jgi:hypothetical protein
METIKKSAVLIELSLSDIEKILKDHFSPQYDVEKITLDFNTQSVSIVGLSKAKDTHSVHRKLLENILNKRMDDCHISVRALNCLKAADINTIGDLFVYNKEDLLKFRNFGKKSLKEIEENLTWWSGFTMEDWTRVSKVMNKTFQGAFSKLMFYGKMKKEVKKTFGNEVWKYIENEKIRYLLDENDASVLHRLRVQKKEWVDFIKKYEKDLLEARFSLMASVVR